MPLCPTGARLDKWIKKEGLSRDAFAKSIGTDRVSLWRWMVQKDGAVPPLEFALKIENVTGIKAAGWVSAELAAAGGSR